MTISPSLITARSPPANGSSIGESARRPAFPGMPWKAGRHKNWGIFNRHFWGGLRPALTGGYSYSRFCELYRAFEKTLSVTMRQTHAAGERLFVDYAWDVSCRHRPARR